MFENNAVSFQGCFYREISGLFSSGNGAIEAPDETPLAPGVDIEVLLILSALRSNNIGHP